MNLSHWMLKHRRSIIFFLTILTLAGLFSAFKVPVALFPNIEFPRILISLNAGDRPADQTVVQVTKPIEEVVRLVPGVQSLRSISSRGSASIFVDFNWGSDTTLKNLQISNAISQILSKLPAETTFNVRSMDPSIFPILAYSLTSKTLSLDELHAIAQYELGPLLSNIPGVARISVVGGAQKEYHVQLIPQKLSAYGLTVQDVKQALTAANAIAAVGKFEEYYKLFLLMTNSQLTNKNDIENVVIHPNKSGVIMLKDIAVVQTSVVPDWVHVDANGENAVLLQIFQQADGNTLSIARDAQKALATYHSLLPVDVIMNNWYDQSKLVADSAQSVRNAILIGIALAALIIFIFLRNIKMTLIAVLVVPASLAVTTLILYVMGISFNVMTLGGMAAAIGLIIDDAIVMLEHLMRRLHAHPDHYHGRITEAALEFAKPLTGSSAATIIIFIPLAFLQGVTGAFFKALSLTMASALIISYLVTWFVIPLLADRFLTLKDAHEKEAGIFTEKCHHYYTVLMQKLLKKPALLLMGLLPLIFLGFISYQQVGSGFMPSMDEGGFNIDYKTPPGTALSETTRLLKQVEKIIHDNSEVESYSLRTGMKFGGADPFSEANEGDIIVKVKSPHEKSTSDIMQEIRTQIEATVPGVETDFGQLMEDVIGDLTAVPQPVEIKLYANDQALLLKTAQEVVKLIEPIAGVVDINNGINLAGDAMMVEINPMSAALEGLDAQAITQQLNTYFFGDVVTQIQNNDQLTGVRVWVPTLMRKSSAEVLNLMIAAPDGHSFPLKQVAKLKTVTGQPQITRQDLKPMIAVTARITGRDMGSVINDIRQKLDAANALPSGVYYELGGLYQQQQIAFHAMMLVFLAAFLLVFLLQLFLYEQFAMVIATMCLPLIAIAAIFLGLWITGIELNIASMMGITMVIGIITEVSIFYFVEYQSLLMKESFSSALLIQAGINRMKPIAMTTVAAILALLPLALGLGQGATMEQPLAVSIISGLMIQLPLVLLVMPVLYDLLFKSLNFISKVKIPTNG